MKSVCCVVVTYNRTSTLRECLTAILLGSTQPDALVVIDNASTDDTVEMVRLEFPLAELVVLPANVGGAGGFHAGMEWAYSRGFDLMWVMDDDGICSPDCLEILLRESHTQAAAIVCPIVVDVKNPSRLSFGLAAKGKIIETLEEAKDTFGVNGFVSGQGSPFNGTLYKREVIDRIGLPDPRLFIRGDEIEYQARYRKAGFHQITTLSAGQRHPAALDEKFPLLGTKFVVNFTGNQLKDYCIFRNNAVIFLKYGRWGKLFFEFPKHCYFFLVKRRLDVVGLGFWMSAYSAGIAGKFGGERKFLAPKKPNAQTTANTQR